MMRTRRTVLVLAALALVGCTQVRTFEMKWQRTATGACKGAGVDPRLASEQEVTLRYAARPNHFHVFCSTKLAFALVATGKPTVPMVERRNGGSGASTSICEIAGIKDDAPGTVCAFQGQVAGGFENAGKPTPWDD